MSCSNPEILIHEGKREERFELFIDLYYSYLKNNPISAYKVFREAYCSTDNIYSQIKKSEHSFDLKNFLIQLQVDGVDFKKLMRSRETEYYKSLPSKFKIYRGASQREYDSKDYGVSWTLSKNEALKYISFKPNIVYNGSGGLLTEEIEKKDVITIFSVYENLDDQLAKNEIIYIAK